MRNILFVSHSAELGGAEQWLCQTAAKIERKKFHAFLVLPCSGPIEDEMKKLGIKTFIVPMKWWLTEKSKIWRQPLAWLWNLRSVFRIAQIIKAQKIDLVLSNSAANFSGALAAKKSGLPHVWVIHEILKGKRASLRYLFGGHCLVRFIQRRSSRVVVNSQATQRAFEKFARVSLVYNGIEIQRAEVSPKNDLKREFGIREGDFVLGVVGKVFEGKGQRELIQAMALLAPKYPRLKLLVVGDIKDKRYFRSLERIILKQGMAGRVIFTGFRADLVQILKLMDLLVFVSLVDSFGRVVIEAMASGTPVLAVRAGGIPEIINHEENGFLVDSPEPEHLAQALESVLKNPDKIETVVQKSYQTVREKFSLDEQVKKIEHILDECLVCE